ncbi:hypothetical protein [Mycobacterium sp. shizuoka-1]|uniref:hypothetical protein n=1 Tax=Mycobacterium sp. shizuoka-1 TaxID=2039281 RepID=UPI000C05E768|nr:hypothetical protein [Mycobacterium sp. shizuoka-1]GAY14025.1 hypothetical protein MSZK_07510 [Mycobacterium sp. shizuoka-1]
MALTGCSPDIDRIANDTIRENLDEKKSALATPTTSDAPDNMSKLLGINMPSGTWLVQASYARSSSREAWGYKGDRLNPGNDVGIRNTIFAVADGSLLRQGWQQCTIYVGGPYSWIKPGTDEFIEMVFMSGPPTIANVSWQNWREGACKGLVQG